jgi:hypothetical protein
MKQDRSGIRVAEVAGGPRLEEFLLLPWRIYEGDPFWVPPLLPEQRRFLDPRRGPFFEIGEAQYFLAYLNGRPAGRLSAHINRAYDRHHDPATGFFGFFECLPEPAVAQALFAAAAQWLGRRGKTRLVGPLNFSVYDEMGLLVEGFDSMPAILQTHNPPYYAELLTGLGFAKVMDWLALRINERPEDEAAMERLLHKIMDGQPLVLRTLRRGELRRRAAEVYHLFNEAWEPNWGHVPLSRSQFDQLFHELRPLIRPELCNLVLDGDRLVAFSITVPDINPVVRSLNGRLSLWGRLRLLYAARCGALRKARALVLGVHQPYQARRLHYAMVINTFLYIVRHTPCEVCDLSLIPENLTSYLRALKSLGARPYKTFRVYGRDIG